MTIDNSSSKGDKAKFLEALQKKKNLTSPVKGENKAPGKAKGARKGSVGTRMFRRKSGSA